MGKKSIVYRLLKVKILFIEGGKIVNIKKKYKDSLISYDMVFS